MTAQKTQGPAQRRALYFPRLLVLVIDLMYIYHLEYPQRNLSFNGESSVTDQVEASMDEQPRNLNQLLLATMETFAKETCFKVKEGTRFRDISYRRFQVLTFRMVKYLHDQGISNGERVAIVIDNCLEWMIIYVATLLSGGVVVPLRSTLAPNTLQYTLRDSGARLVVLNDEQHLLAIPASLGSDQSEFPELQSVLVTDEEATEFYPEAVPVAELLARTNRVTSEEIESIRAYALGTPPETLVSIHYTSGETGRLKGAVFDQARGLKIMQHMAAWLPLDEEDVALTIAPWSSSPSLKAALHYFLSGVPNVLAIPRGSEAVAEDMQQTSPTVTLNSPYFYERFYDSVMEEVAQMPEATQTVFHWAVAKGKEYWAAGPNASDELKEAYARADLTFFSRFRGQVGGRMKKLYSAGAPFPHKLADFFEAIGLPILNVYSLSEAGGFPAVSRSETYRPGSCGQVAPGFEIRLAEDGEVLVRSAMAMSEYWGWPLDMAQTLDAEGWLHTGDLGRFDEDGYLYLTGRKQSLMVLSTGRKIMPGTIEQALMANPFIDQAVVFGEGWPYVTALIVPDLLALAEHFQEEGSKNGEIAIDAESDSTSSTSGNLNWFWQPEDMDSEPVTTSAHPKVKAILDKVVAEINARLDRWEQIREYSLLEQAHSKAANELNEVMPKGRHLIAEQYGQQIEQMYPQATQLEEAEITRVRLSPERMRELLEKERMLDAWMEDAGIQFLFDLARTKQIDVPSMVHISDTAATIAQMENEEKPLSTAFIVGDPARISRILPRSEVQLLRTDHIRRMRPNLITLAKMVDGLVLGYVVDRHGYVRSIRRLKLDQRQLQQLEQSSNQFGNLLLGPQFRQRAAISELCDAVVFFVPTGGRQVRVFADGKLVGRYSNGDWTPENMSRLDYAMTQLTDQESYDPVLLRRILRCAFQMSEENLGAIFIVGNADEILENSDAPEISHLAMIVSADIAELTDRELINFAKQDGATVVDVEGKFRGCMVLLRPRADTRAEIGPGQGARHSSAAKMSTEAECLAITVSQDGPVTIYDSGRRVLSL